MGINVVDAIIAARKSKGQFSGFADFLRKVPLVVCNKRVIESLVKAGAFDSYRDARKGLVLVHEQAVDAVIDLKRNAFDAFLRLAAPTGMLIAFDDNSGGGTNARITYRANATGMYRIFAISHNGKVGPFQLTVTENP